MTIVKETAGQLDNLSRAFRWTNDVQFTRITWEDWYSSLPNNGNRELKTFLLHKANLDTDVYNFRFLIQEYIQPDGRRFMVLTIRGDIVHQGWTNGPTAPYILKSLKQLHGMMYITKPEA